MAENPWITVLMITILGMGLLFLALAFFYGLLSAMARMLQDRAAAPVTGAMHEAMGAGEQEAQLQAAAVAVALARAGLGAPLTDSPALQAGRGGVMRATSPWWLLHHQQRLTSGARGRRGR